MKVDSILSASTSPTLAAPRALLSNRSLRSLLGLGLLAAAGGLVPGCGAEATEVETSAPGEQVGEASQALSPTCITIVRGGPGGVSDTRLRQDMPTTASGSVATLVTGNQPTNRVALLRFDLSPIPAGAVITSADVTLYEVVNQGPATVSVHLVTDVWNEATVTWNSFNNEYTASSVTSFANGGAVNSGPISFSLASTVQAWVTGSTNNGIALLAPTNNTWSSSEAVIAAQRPSLAVCYLPAAEVCDGVDNDSDGQIDEDSNLGAPCTAGVGACVRNGVIACTGSGGAACNAIPGAPVAEVCDGVDNDCDGQIDEGFTPATCVGGAPSSPVALAAGYVHSLALKPDGTVWAVGYNSSGQLGDGTTTNRLTPVQVAGLSGVTAVAAGDDHSLALRSDGTVWGVGYNSFGQLGTATVPALVSVPRQVNGFSNIVAMAGGGMHSLGLKSDGTVWAVGENWLGQLGDGTNIQRLTAVQVIGLSSITAIAAGATHSLALKSDGTVWATGANYFSQLGDGTTTERVTPVQVLGLSSVTAIAAGATHSLAVKSDGTVWAVGRNDHGQLGDGTTTQRLTPVQVIGLSSVTAIAAGATHSLARRSDGTVWGVGYNIVGPLGDGTNTNRTTAVLSLLP